MKIKMSGDIQKLLNQQIADREEQLGRPLLPEEPIFTQSAAEIKDGIVKALKQGKIDPAFIHAFRETGRLVTKENRKLFSTSELKEWDHAVGEYNYQVSVLMSAGVSREKAVFIANKGSEEKTKHK